jgi:hypothetical protein
VKMSLCLFVLARQHGMRVEQLGLLSTDGKYARQHLFRTLVTQVSSNRP